MLIKKINSANAALIIVLAYFSFGLTLAKQVFAAQNPSSKPQIERSEEELLILEVHVNGTIRNHGIIAYLPEGETLDNTLIPISSLSRSLSYSIRAKPFEGIADGWFKNERNIFHLDLNKNTILINGKETHLSDGAAEAHFEDIYIQASKLQEWLGVSIRPDISTLRLFISSKTPFPFEESEARKNRGNALNTPHINNKIIYNPDVMIPYKLWGKPNIIWQNSIQGKHTDRQNTANASFSLQAKADALNFSSNLLVAGATGSNEKTRINNAKLSFEKRDPNNSLLGILKAGKISFGDVNYPDVPLIIGRKRGRGIAISSDSNYGTTRSLSREKYNVDGDAPIGWDAELYRNGYFIAFQDINSNGRYNFEDTELVRGFNLFQIILYGPEGQKRTDTQRIIRGAEMLQKGVVEYDFAAGQPEADFLPIADNSKTDSTLGGSGRVFYGIRNNLTIGASMFSGSDLSDNDIKRSTSASLTAVTAFSGLKTQIEFMQANQGRSAYNIETTTQLMGANLSASHTKYDGFSEDSKDLLSSSGIEVNKNFGRFSASARAEKNSYQGKDDEIEIRNTLSTRISRVRLTNELNRTLSDNKSQESFDGDISILTNLWDWRLRGKLNYDLQQNANERLNNLNISAVKKINRSSTMRVNSTYNFSSDITTADLRYSKEFDKFSLDMNLGGTTENDYFGGLTYRVGLQPDHNGKYQVTKAKDSLLGSVGLRTFLDNNGNRKYDEGEKLLPNISFRSNHGEIKGHTDENGSIFINGLTENLTKLKLNNNSMPSIYIRPYDDFITILPRSGATTTIDVGFEQLGEIDGFVLTKDENNDDKAIAGIEILLIDANTNEEVEITSSEYDGYYIFSALKVGKYIVKALPIWGENSDITPIKIEITNDAAIATDQNITLQTIMPKITQQAEPIPTYSEQNEHITHIIEDEPLPVITDGLDIATGEELRGLFIHIGSVSSFQSAKEEQERLWGRYPDALGKIPLYIYKIQVGDKVYFRIIGTIEDFKAGRNICDKLVDDHAPGGCNIVEL